MRKVLFSISLLLISACAQAGEVSFTLGVHPYLDAKEIQRRFGPLADYLSRHLGRDVKVHVGIDYKSHIQAVGEDRLDIAFLGPAPYVELTRLYGAKPLLARIETAGKPSFHGHIFVRGESPIVKLSDLRGKRFAFGDPESTMGTLVPRDMLGRAGVGLAELGAYWHITGHKNVALAVLAGAADAGAVKAEIFELYGSRGLRSIARTPPISEHLFVTRADLEPGLIARLRELLLGLREAEEVGRVLAPIKKIATALVAADDSDYDNLREITRRSAGPFGETGGQ